MWFTAARSNTYSPSPARLAPGVRARIADEEFEHRFRVHDGIEIEALERIRRRLPKLAFRLGAHVPTVHETPGLIGNESAAMGEADLQRGMALEHAAEHETCGR